MKKLIYITLLICFYSSLMCSQESASVQVVARSLPNKVMLRWAVDQPLEWKKANEYGFEVERALISRNDQAVLPIEKKYLNTAVIKPRPLEEWATLANQDQNVAILAQALFGSTFETTAPAAGVLGSIVAVNDELEQRFTFGLLAAEQSYQGALLAGWAIEDNSVLAGEEYVYTVKVATPDSTGMKIKKGTVYAGPGLYEELPKPIGLAGVFGDKNVMLSWNFNLLSNYYNRYFVERSTDGKTYVPLNGVPLFNATKNVGQEKMSLFYSDSIPNNTDYYYRVNGKTAFGETSPPSEPLMGKATESLKFDPRIYKKKIPADDKVILFWEFDEKGNDLISKFQLKRSNTNEGPYEVVIDDIPISSRQIEFNSLKRINYFVISAIGQNGVNAESYPSMVQPVDSIPPAPPKNLVGKMDTTGLITIQWDKNIEPDLQGYRIFKSNNPNVEFSEVTAETFLMQKYTDTITSVNLNKKIYYKIQAEDQRYNRSLFSKILVIDKPDIIAPSPPVFKKYVVTEEGIRLNWIPSSSTDVAAHMLYRKNGNESETNWEEIAVLTSIKDTTFLDSDELIRGLYNYTMIAKDSASLESSPSRPISIKWKGQIPNEKELKFSGTVNRELRFINLTWRIKDFNISEYRLFKGSNEDGLKLYKTFDGNSKFYNDVALEINSNYIYGLQLIMSDGQTTAIKKIALKY